MSTASIENELAVIERGLKALHVEYERFFTGDLKRPPADTRRRVEELLKRLAAVNVDRAAERFRLQNLQSRFSSLTELWEKRLRARDEGRAVSGRVPAPRRGEALGTEGGPEPDTDASASVKGGERAVLMPLFSRYCEARRALGEDISRVRYERFEEALRKQAADIRKRTGARRLVFEVQTVEGRVRVVGRPAPVKGAP